MVTLEENQLYSLCDRYRKFINLAQNKFFMVGNIPNFTKVDILRCFLMLDKNIGRQELAKKLQLGEGTVRTILDTLKSKKLLESNKKGHFLSKNGSEMLSNLLENVECPKEIVIHNIYPNLKKIGIKISNAKNLKELYKLRDIAIKNGADGAIILKYEGRLYAPESGYEQDYKQMEKYFNFKENEILIVSFSNEKRFAENGAFAIAAELNDTLKKFISEL